MSVSRIATWICIVPIYCPAVARESTATMTPPLNRNASVVVPCLILILQDGSAWSSVCSLRNEVG